LLRSLEAVIPSENKYNLGTTEGDSFSLNCLQDKKYAYDVILRCFSVTTVDLESNT